MLGAVVIVAAALACGVLRLRLGAGFLLDDFYLLRRVEQGWSLWEITASGDDRPIGALVVGAVFRWSGMRPGPVIVLMAVANGLVGVLLRSVLQRVVAADVALLTALAWVTLPAHSALEAWPSTVAILAACLALLGALRLISGEDPQPWAPWAAAVLAAVATLSYESAGLFLIVLVPWVRWGTRRRVEPRVVLPVAAGAAACLAWSALRWPSARSATGTFQDLSLVLPANFGRGIVPAGRTADLLLVAALGAAVACIWDRRAALLAAPDARAIALGVPLLLLGTGPYAFYLYEPFGVGDRFNYVSSVGGALVWAGILLWLTARLRLVGWAFAAVALGLVLNGRHHESDLWSRAGLDAARFVAGTVHEHPAPDRPIVVAPGIISAESIGPFFDAANIRIALEYGYGSAPVEVRVATDEEDYADAVADPEVITVDQRPTSTLLEVPSAFVQYP